MMVRIIERLALALLFVSLLGARPREEVLEAKVFRAADGRSMPYRLFVPESYTTQRMYPRVLFLHGGGGRGSDNRKQIEGGNGNLVDLLVGPETQVKHACIVVAPQSSRLGWVEYDSITPTDQLELVLELLQYLERTYRTTPIGAMSWDRVFNPSPS
jgi:predicted peptidase